MGDYLATIFALSFQEPKPLHPLVMLNWARCSYARFKIFTDHADAWRRIISSDTKNIELIDISVPNFFALSYDLFGVNSEHEFVERCYWMIRPNEYTFDGYHAPQLRPAITRLDQGNTPYVGWIDNDVLINAEPLRKHIERSSFDMLLFPPHTMFFEAFKLFSANINVAALFKDMVDQFQVTRVQPPSPLEAEITVRMALRPDLSRDNIGFDQFAIHHEYIDLLIKMHNEGRRVEYCQDVTVHSDLSLSSSDGCEPYFFVADREVKTFGAEEAAAAMANIANGGHLFRWISCHP